MTFELAKRLKDAGFPQPYGHSLSGDRYFFIGEGYTMPFRVIKEVTTHEGLVPDFEKELTYIPTLNELITACYSYFQGLQVVSPDEWMCVCAGGIKGIGDNPVTAVAEAWLKLAERYNK